MTVNILQSIGCLQLYILSIQAVGPYLQDTNSAPNAIFNKLYKFKRTVTVVFRLIRKGNLTNTFYCSDISAVSYPCRFAKQTAASPFY